MTRSLVSKIAKEQHYCYTKACPHLIKIMIQVKFYIPKMLVVVYLTHLPKLHTTKMLVVVYLTHLPKLYTPKMLVVIYLTHQTKFNKVEGSFMQKYYSDDY